MRYKMKLLTYFLICTKSTLAMQLGPLFKEGELNRKNYVIVKV